MHPHEVCLLGNQFLIFWQTLTNLLIGASYMYIAYRLSLLWKYSKNELEPNRRWIPAMFAAFILFCGFTHFIDIWVIYQPHYYIQTFVLALCALASIGTATGLQMIARKNLKVAIVAADKPKNEPL